MSDESLGDIETAIDAIVQETEDIVMRDEPTAAETTSLFSSAAMQELNFRVLIRKVFTKYLKINQTYYCFQISVNLLKQLLYHQELQNVISYSMVWKLISMTQKILMHPSTLQILLFYLKMKMLSEL